MLSITFYSRHSQHMGSIDFTLDFAHWLLEKGLYRIEGVRASHTLVLIEEEEEYTYEIEVILLTIAARKKLLAFFSYSIIQESLLTNSWKLELLHSINDFLDNDECLYMDYLA
jgi:hypothetical protein